MTERGRGALTRSADMLRIGPSAMRWDGRSLTIGIDEVAVPHMTRIRGAVRVTPAALTDAEYALDPQGRHLWRPFAPVSEIDVDLENPRLRWTGAGYWDGNFGARPLEADFVRWDWSRAHLADGAAVLYDATLRGRGESLRALRFAPDGSVAEEAAPARSGLGRGLWRVARSTRSEDAARVVQRLEDAPFYTRELIDTTVMGERATAMHESLDLDRFASPVVKAMLPFRMPRRR